LSQQDDAAVLTVKSFSTSAVFRGVRTPIKPFTPGRAGVNAATGNARVGIGGFWSGKKIKIRLAKTAAKE
jgi:hypothetical protein